MCIRYLWCVPHAHVLCMGGVGGLVSQSVHCSVLTCVAGVCEG